MRLPVMTWDARPVLTGPQLGAVGGRHGRRGYSGDHAIRATTLEEGADLLRNSSNQQGPFLIELAI
jgi:hypothetical protein